MGGLVTVRRCIGPCLTSAEPFMVHMISLPRYMYIHISLMLLMAKAEFAFQTPRSFRDLKDL